MKRILIIVFVIFACFGQLSLVEAKTVKVKASATASGEYNSYFHAGNAADDSPWTRWLGEYNSFPCWIMFDLREVQPIENVKIFWCGSYYIPSSYDILVSSDGVDWESVYSNVSDSFDSGGTVREINREARYIKCHIDSGRYYGAITEFEIYKKINIPNTMRFQGDLKTASGDPLNGDYSIAFRLYEEKDSGAPIWEETQQNISITAGLLDVALGSANPIDVSFDRQYWLGVEVESDGEMTPRFALSSAPYAFTAEQ